MATPASTYYRPDPDRGAMAKFLALLFGIGLVIVLALAFWAVIAAQKARDDAHKVANGAPAATASTHDMSHGLDRRGRLPELRRARCPTTPMRSPPRTSPTPRRCRPRRPAQSRPCT